LPADPGLLPGTFAEASINLGQARLLALPRSALIADADGFHVMQVIDGKAAIRPVTLGTLPGNISPLVPVVAGIAPGNVIVAAAGASLRDDEAVRTTP
jgi:HlyD family secretion protein